MDEQTHRKLLSDSDVRVASSFLPAKFLRGCNVNESLVAWERSIGKYLEWQGYKGATYKHVRQFLIR